MFTVTDNACARLAAMLEEHEAGDDVVIRIIREEGSKPLVLILDNARPDDKTFAHEGRTVLAIDKPVFESLANQRLDADDTGNEPKLVPK